jgi:hypothetical protein
VAELKNRNLSSRSAVPDVKRSTSKKTLISFEPSARVFPTSKMEDIDPASPESSKASRWIFVSGCVSHLTCSPCALTLSPIGYACRFRTFTDRSPIPERAFVSRSSRLQMLASKDSDFASIRRLCFCSRFFGDGLLVIDLLALTLKQMILLIQW